MTDEKNNSPAADTPQTMSDFFEMVRQYDDATKTQEILDNILQKYAQYEQEAQEIKPKSIKGYSIDIDSKAILLNGKTEPALDPNSTKFNPAQYYSYAGALYDQLKQRVLSLNKAYSGVVKSMLKTDAMQELFTNMQRALAPLFSNVENDLGEFTNELYKNLFGPIYDLIENSDVIKERLEEWQQLQPYLEEELKKPEYNGLSLKDLIDNEYKDENGNVKENSLFQQAVDNARKALKGLPADKKITVKKADIIEYPLDKVNSKIWRLLEIDTNGQIEFAMEKRGSKRELSLFYSINFDETLGKGLTISKRLTAFDKRVYVAISALYNAGNKVISLTQIYYAMGYKGNPGTTDLQKIQASIIKMQGAQITLDNEQEAATYKKYGLLVYRGSLLPLESGEHYNINGSLTDAAIHLFREPPMLTLAKIHKQITTVEVKLLQSPINKTDNNLAIDDYLIERISRMKNPNSKSSNKILYNSIFEAANIKKGKPQARCKNTIIRYLDYYKSVNFIKGYKEVADGILIHY